MTAAGREVLERAKIGVNGLSLVVPHQANMRIIRAVQKALEVPDERCSSTSTCTATPAPPPSSRFQGPVPSQIARGGPGSAHHLWRRLPLVRHGAALLTAPQDPPSVQSASLLTPLQNEVSPDSRPSAKREFRLGVSGPGVVVLVGVGVGWTGVPVAVMVAVRVGVGVGGTGVLFRVGVGVEVGVGVVVGTVPLATSSSNS